MQAKLESDARYVRAVCRGFPKAPVPQAIGRRVHSRIPMLFLTGNEDPADPPASVADARRQLPNSRTVIFPASGHGQLGYLCSRAPVADSSPADSHGPDLVREDSGSAAVRLSRADPSKAPTPRPAPVPDLREWNASPLRLSAAPTAGVAAAVWPPPATDSGGVVGHRRSVARTPQQPCSAARQIAGFLQTAPLAVRLACRLDGSDPGRRGASPISVRKPRSDLGRSAPSQPIAPARAGSLPQGGVQGSVVMPVTRGWAVASLGSLARLFAFIESRRLLQPGRVHPHPTQAPMHGARDARSHAQGEARATTERRGTGAMLRS